MDLVQSQTQSYSDESLCRLAASGDPLAETELVGRYTRLVRVCPPAFFLAGGDSEDLIQEGMLGLLAAIRGFQRARRPPSAPMRRFVSAAASMPPSGRRRAG